MSVSCPQDESYSEIGVNTVKYLDEGLWNMVVPKTASDVGCGGPHRRHFASPTGLRSTPGEIFFASLIMMSSNSVCSRTPSWPWAKPFWILFLWQLLLSRKACNLFLMNDENILYGTDCKVIDLKLFTLDGSPFLSIKIVTPT